jgi:hypothetical protein
MPYHSYGRLTDDDAGALASHEVASIVGPSEKPKSPCLCVVVPK